MILLPLGTWVELKDGDHDAFELFKRHYSFYRYADNRRDDPTNPTRRLFVGPGKKVVLMAPDGKALFVWRKFIDKGRPKGGVNCSVFRNEGPRLSSELILEAEVIARGYWPTEDFYTYVNDKKIRGTNPGYCFIKAGWVRLKERTGSGLVILEKRYEP